MRVFLVVFLLFISSAILACSCSRIGILEGKKAATFVFKGKVVKMTEITTTDTITGTDRTVEYVRTIYTFEIKRNYKGLSDKSSVELLMADVDTCAVSFEEGETYIVYAYTYNKKLHRQLIDQETSSYMTTHLCTRTSKMNVLTIWESFLLWLT